MLLRERAFWARREGRRRARGRPFGPAGRGGRALGGRVAAQRKFGLLWKGLAEHLPTSLKLLYLDNNQIGDEGCTALAEHLPTSLKLLYLDNNQIGDEGCTALAEHLPTSLKVLGMGFEHPTLRAACEY